MIKLGGTYFDGRSGQGHEVIVHRHGGLITISGDRIELSFPVDELQVDPRLANLRRAIRIPGGAQVQTDDQDALDEMFPAQSRGEGFVHTLEKRWEYALAGLLALAIAVWWTVQYGLPIVAKSVAFRVPVGIEEQLAARTLDALDKTFLSPSLVEKQRREALTERFRALVAGLGDGYRYRLEFRSCGVIANAFALPGGTIVVTDGLVSLAANDEQILTVLAHEIGHVRSRHGVRMMLQGAGVAALASTLAGDAMAITGLAASLPALLTETSYSREFETEADNYALEHLSARGISPRHFADILEALQKQAGEVDSGILNYLSTHPATADRIRRARERR